MGFLLKNPIILRFPFNELVGIVNFSADFDLKKERKQKRLSKHEIHD